MRVTVQTSAATFGFLLNSRGVLMHWEVTLRRFGAASSPLYIPIIARWGLLDARHEMSRCFFFKRWNDGGTRGVLGGMRAARMKHTP